MVVTRRAALIQVQVDMTPGYEMHCGKQSTWYMEDNLISNPIVGTIIARKLTCKLKALYLQVLKQSTLCLSKRKVVTL